LKFNGCVGFLALLLVDREYTRKRTELIELLHLAEAHIEQLPGPGWVRIAHEIIAPSKNIAQQILDGTR
jgi:hypothetical protein